MYILDGHCYAKLVIGGREYPLAHGRFEKFWIIQNVVQKLPSFSIDLHDYSGVLVNDGVLSDGASIEISMGQSMKQEQRTIKMMFVGTPNIRPLGGVGIVAKLKGILDATTMFNVVKKPYEGTSSDAIAFLAKEAGMTTVCDPTNDKMIWRPNNKSYDTFISHIAQHGWASDNSILQTCVTEKKELRYYNLDDRLKREPSVGFYYGNPSDQVSKSFAVAQRSFQSMPGVTNLNTNYGYQIGRENMDGQYKKTDKFNVPKGVGFLNFSRTRKDEYGENKARNSYLPPDYKNTNDKYADGMYQNSRGLLTFSNIVSVLVPFHTSVDLLDLVDYTESDPNTGRPVQAVSGKYFVTAKTRFIQGNIYCEKIELSNQGRNDDPTNSLL